MSEYTTNKGYNVSSLGPIGNKISQDRTNTLQYILAYNEFSGVRQVKSKLGNFEVRLSVGNDKLPVINPANGQNRHETCEAAAAQKLIAFKTCIRNLISAKSRYRPKSIPNMM